MPPPPRRAKKPRREVHLIAEGSYGCVFYPGLNCRGHVDTPNYVTKLQVNKQSTQNEWTVSQKVKNIPGYAKYFAPILKQCRVRVSKDKAAEVSQCGVLRKAAAKARDPEAATPPSLSDSAATESSFWSNPDNVLPANSVVVSNKMRYVGERSLGKFLKSLFAGAAAADVDAVKSSGTNATPLPPTLGLFRSASSSATDTAGPARTLPLHEFWRTHAYVLKGLQLLWKEQHIVHFDLKSNNIMYDDAKDHPVIIDFGLSILHDKVGPASCRHYFFTFDSYDFWCIDVVVCSYIARKVGAERAKRAHVTEAELSTIVDVFFRGNAVLEDLAVDPAAAAAASSAAPVVHASATATFPGTTSRRLSANEFKTRCLAYFARFVDAPWWDLFEHLQGFANTWDNYSTAMIYWTVLDDAYRANPSAFAKMQATYGKKYTAYVALLESVIFALPDERPDAAHTRRRVPTL